jgi:putative tricarboxylic transport membrane protein
MRFSDAATGVVAMIVGIAVVAHARTFPPMPGQPVGPSLFPSLIGGAMVLAGLGLIVAGARGEAQPLIHLDDWVRRPRMVLNFALVVAMLLFYAVVLHRVGFFLTAFLFLTVLFVSFGVTRKWIVPLSVVTVFLIHYGFYTLLRVPLPWGVLEGLAW